MQLARDIHGAAFAGATATLLARLVDEYGDPISPAEIVSAVYSIDEAPLDYSAPPTAVTGHQSRSLTVADVLNDTLQLDAAWDVDGVGYNFKHTPDASTDAPFPDAGATYEVRYTFTNSAGLPVVFRFRIDVV